MKLYLFIIITYNMFAYDRDHDLQTKVLSNLMLFRLLKYISRLIYTAQNIHDRILPSYYHRTKCPRYATQTINSTNCPFTLPYVYCVIFMFYSLYQWFLNFLDTRILFPLFFQIILYFIV